MPYKIEGVWDNLGTYEITIPLPIMTIKTKGVS